MNNDLIQKITKYTRINKYNLLIFLNNNANISDKNKNETIFDVVNYNGKYYFKDENDNLLNKYAQPIKLNINDIKDIGKINKCMNNNIQISNHMNAISA